MKGELMSALVIKGDIRKLRKRTERVRSGRSVNGAISTEFRGNGKAALSITPTASGLGASTRQGWRLSCTPAERAAAGVTGVTNNSAEYVAYNGPQSATGYSHPLMDGRNNGRKVNAK